MGFDPVSRLLFPAPLPSYDETTFRGELLWIPTALNGGTKNAQKENIQRTAPEDRIPCIFLKYPSARFVIFYLHTNAEDLGKCHAFCSCMRAQFQVHVFAVEYPGYGICPGGPCDEHGLTENAFAGLHFVHEVMKWPLDSILIVGRSIGCGPAISLAVRYQVSGVIIISPMLSFRELCKDLVGPLASVVTERFPNKSRMQFLRSAVLVIHGQKDVTIPYRHGLELFQMCKSRKLFVGPEDMGHNANMFANVSYMVMPMLHFFALPDYCFDDITVPSWAYDRSASMDSREPEVPITVPARVRAPWEEPLDNAARPQDDGNPQPQAPAPPDPDPVVPEKDTPIKQLAVPALPIRIRPAPESPKRPATIRLPLKAEQERTASRSLLSAVSDQPSRPVTHEAVVPPTSIGDDEVFIGVCKVKRLPLRASYGYANPLLQRVPCCFSCPAVADISEAWEASDGQEGSAVMKASLVTHTPEHGPPSAGQGDVESSAKFLDPVIAAGSSGWGNGL